MPDGDVSEVGNGLEKDPKKIARKYQLDLCKKALEENVIVYLETGCGKTHIAVLLIYELSHLIRKPQQNICVFLAPTVALVQQQARVIEESLDMKVGCYSGGSKRLKTHEEWEKEIEKYEVFVMTPMILLQNLSHQFMKMEFIALLIFDECHHAQIKSGHPYAEIMKVFYKDDLPKLPRIFGMTASPIVGRGASDLDNLSRCINSLERLLDAKVYTVEDRGELDNYVAPPVIKVYFYGSTQPGASISYKSYFDQLEEIKRQCLSMLSRKTDDFENIQSTKRMLGRIHESILVCAEKLGLWGAMQACQIFLGLGVDNSERLSVIEAEGNSSDMSVCDLYLNKASTLNEDDQLSNLSSKEGLTEPLFSSKLSCLVGILSSFRSRPNMKCIVFVNRVVVAMSLTYILKNIAVLGYWKCDYLVGINSAQRSMSRKNMKIILEKFQSGKLNLLVATKVGEEGLDIQSCCLVIRFDPPETVASFIQSRGRARVRHSEYAFLVDRHSNNELDLIEKFKKEEARMNVEIASRTSEATFSTDEESIYKVESSGASVSSAYSLSLLYQYCAKLPHDEYFDPLPRFYYFDDTEGTICHIILPSNSPIHQIISTTQMSREAAKKDASLRAIKELHEVGALDDYLLPLREHANQEEMMSDYDFDNIDDKAIRGELHEMLVPSVLKEAWSHSDEVVHLNYYFISFCPDPVDRTYKEFGLFVKTPLPSEAEVLELELHLAHGRTVTTKLIHLGVVGFDKNEIFKAQKFQEMFLKVILDRAEFVQGFVALGENKNFPAGVSLFYLLLPVLCYSDKNNFVDWKTIRRCLSSPVFGNPTDGLKRVDTYSESTVVLENGTLNISDVENSLVYVPHKKEFYFVTSINWDKNGHSLYKEADRLTHVENLSRKFGIHLKHAEQPLLHAKPLFSLHNLLHKRKQEDSGARELEEYFIDLPPELCQLKILGFSKDIGSSLSLLPSIIHRLVNLLVAVQLKEEFSMSFPEGKEVTAETLLKALTTEKCQERFSLERLEVLGDAFLKFSVGRHLFLLHDALDEGGLTGKRSNTVNNSNLFKLAVEKNLQVYIRDQPFEPSQFFAVVDSGFKAATAFLKWIGINTDFNNLQVSKALAASVQFMPLTDIMDVHSIQHHLGYKFKHVGLLLQAFIHPSYNKHAGGCYQRLEFLGDAVLDYLITSYLFTAYPKLKPGQLTDLRSLSVNNKAFAGVAVARSFHQFLLHDSPSLSKAIEDFAASLNKPARERGSQEGPKCPKALGDVVESSVGAFLLDTGFDLNKSRNWDLELPATKDGNSYTVEARVKGKNISVAASCTNRNKNDAIKISALGILAKLKAAGHLPKTTPLEEALKSTPKMKPKLIGYDEAVVEVSSSGPTQFDHIKVESVKYPADSRTSVNKSPTRIVSLSDQLLRQSKSARQCLTERIDESSSCSDLKRSGEALKSAKSHLHEICAANCWNPPLFECCQTEGPGHLMLFTYKVIVEVEDSPNRVLECFSEPRPKKKAAAEHAAEGAIWYLKHQGYIK
ncbi:hypothetical protein MLD38_005667 [Melastoma candidum]|uniref:Uncharacterized protein n=1 Tax=Melastoma candidum TaxID=119954 RepID=A0ACB9RKY3_9MYRT|nr:hypothetical protein MLD38_005667 [Melastoma candidum]